MGSISIASIFSDLEVLNQGISVAVADFNIWVDECREDGLSDGEILEEINSQWEFSSFGSLEEAIEWFEDLGI